MPIRHQDRGRKSKVGYKTLEFRVVQAGEINLEDISNRLAIEAMGPVTGRE